MSRVRVNYKSDVPPIGVTFMLGDHEVPVPTTDFVVRFFVEGSPGPSFECIHKGEEYINCEVTSEDTLTCYINNHEFGCGRLCCEFIDLSRNVKYADGVQKTVTPTKLDVVLVDGAGDDLVEITESIAIDIETIIGEIREAMEALDGYANIIAALQAAVATIPNVIDDLETGGHTDALSAEQGKILKEIIDNIGRISIEGITGFTPISSLNELPENPTTEQKRQAYLFENALYVYVGAGGDTLDGKYQSVELVSLDWGDKSYNASEFSGLGRRWLKKNMVEGVNVLTAAMIGTANTEYFIQYDYEIEEVQTDPTDPDSKVRIINLPANSTLVFMGGSIKNGILVGNNTRIVAKKGVCIFDGITIQGTWDVTEAYSSWFKMHKMGYKIVDNSVTENAVTKYHGSDNVYHEFGTLTAKSDVYFVKSTLSSGAVKVDSVFVPFLTLEFYRGSDNEQHALSTLTSVSNVNFVKSTLGEGSNVVESSVFATATTGIFYKGTDKKYYTIDEVTLIDGVYYVTSTLVDGEVGPNSVATTAVTMYLASDEKYYEASSLQSVDSTYFVTSTLNSGAVKVDSVFAVGVYKGNNNEYYSLGRLVQVASTNFVASTLDSGSVTYGSVFTVSEVYATFRVEGYDADSSIDYVAAAQTVTGTFDASGYEQYDDADALQSLFDLRAKKAIVEDGIYMVRPDKYSYRISSSKTGYVSLYYDAHKNSELVIDGWIKLQPNGYTNTKILDVISCDGLRITGKGGIQGDMPEHKNNNQEYGFVLSVSNTRNLTVDGLTFAYAWGDNIYSHWWQNGRVVNDNSLQKFHTYKNVSVIYGRRTGYGCELADNVVFDSCYFYGNGRVRGTATNSAVDIEPFNYADTPQRYVMNYEFKNNVFKNSANGIRLERCVNCSVHDNYFDYGWSGVYVVSHGDVSYDITSPTDRGWLKSYMKIYNNHIKRCSRGITLGYSTMPCENVEVYGNTLVSCSNTFITPNNIIRNCKIYNNTTYGCGQWELYAMESCDIYNNHCYACVMPEATVTWGANVLLSFRNVDGCKGTSFHNNHFSLDYGESIYGLGQYGKEELYHGMPVGNRYVFCATPNGTNDSTKIHFYDNELSDDFIVYWGNAYNFQNNAFFRGGICSLRNEHSEVFLENDIFRSVTYGDEGIVTAGGIISCSWLNDARDFEPYMEVAYGEIIKLDTRFAICDKAGTCGATLELGQGECGTARFLTANPYIPDTNSANRIKIAFKTRGVCTSETRPDSFLYAGRRMWETDTNKEIVYDGSDWVYNDIYTEE